MPAKKKARRKTQSRRMSRDKIARLVELFEGEVNNGGFDQFFYNSLGNETADIIEALETIEASKITDILKRAAMRFPEGKPPKNRIARGDLLMERVSPSCDAFDDLDASSMPARKNYKDFWKSIWAGSEDDLRNRFVAIAPR
jgi:hypothetical protein